MKVLHIAETIWGGCGTYLNEIVPLQLHGLGADRVHCLVPRQHVAHLGDVPAEVLSTFDRPGRLAGLPRLAAGTIAAVRRFRPDLIHAHSTFAGAIVRTLSLAWPMPPIVYCPHGWVFDVGQSSRARAATRLAERMLSHRASRIVAISQAERLQGEEAGIRSEKLVVVPNGIRGTGPQDKAEWNDPRLKLLFVGRLDRQKGVDVLLQAVAAMGERVSVRIVGEQVLVGEKSLSSENRLPHVEFLGWRDKAGVAAQINACDLVVMPSRWEGFGLVAIEAMRAGKPVVASAVGGLVEIIIDGVTGRLVPADDPDALAAALAIDSSSSLQAMGAAGRARFLQHFTSDRTHEGLMQVYAQALAGGSPAAAAAARVGAAGRGG